MEEYVIDVLKSRMPMLMDRVKARIEENFLVATTGIIPRFVVLNQSAKEIFQLCDGNNVEKIIKCVADKHSDVDSKKITQDVIIGLRDLESANLITLINRGSYE